MIANFFSKTKPSNIVSILLLFYAFYISSLFKLDFTPVTIAQIGKELSLLSSWLLLLFFVYFIIRKNNLTKDNSYAIFLYVLFIGFFYTTIHNVPLILSNIFLLMALRRIFSLTKKNRIKSKLFDAGLWIGISFVFNPWTILFLLLIFLGMRLSHRVNLPNLIVPILGLATPLLLIYTYCLFINDMVFFEQIFNFPFHFESTPYLALKLLIPITFLIAVVLWSALSCSPKILSRANSMKRSWVLLSILLTISTIVILCTPNKDGSEFLYAFFPAAIITSNYLETIRNNWIKEIVLWLIIAVSFLVYFL